METLCRIRDIYRSIAEFEASFQKLHNLCLNEGMLLCSLDKRERLSSGEIAELLGLTTSNASKVIKSVEKKGYVTRILGDTDKRHMYFTLTPEGIKQFNTIKYTTVVIPAILEEVL